MTTTRPPAADAADLPADLDGEGAAARGGRPRDEAREQAILDAVVTLVATVGYDRMSMDAVATAARASKATIYRRWPGKVELVVAALRCHATGPEIEIEPLGSLRAELMALVRTVRQHIQGLDGGLVRGVVAAASNDPELAEALKAEFGHRKRLPLDRIVERAVARGELPEHTSGDVVAEVVPAVMFLHNCNRLDFDDDYETHLVDDIAIPLLHHGPGCRPRPA